jgi:hypothetical protein
MDEDHGFLETEHLDQRVISLPVEMVKTVYTPSPNQRKSVKLFA